MPPDRTKDAAFINFISDFQRQHQFAPSIREIVAAFGLSTTSVACARLERLRNEGYVDWQDGFSRTLHVVKAPDWDGRPNQKCQS